MLKHHETFAVFDRYGEINNSNDSEEGLYYKGTRHLSQSEFTLGIDRPLLLNSTITHDNLLLNIDLSNPDFKDLNGKLIPRGSIHVYRSTFLHQHSGYESIVITNFAKEHIRVPITFRFSADFKDIFEIRGHARKKRGEMRESQWEDSRLLLSYRGLDGVERRTRISFWSEHAKFQTLADGTLHVIVEPLHHRVELFFCYDFSSSEDEAPINTDNPKHRYKRKLVAINEEFHVETSQDTHITTSNEPFNQWLLRSHSDLRLMITQTPLGPYPYAGVPWFSAPFGRDGIITALQTLWINPDIARGVLKFLSKMQATEVSDERDSEPGKILHEFRYGEMANLKEIPFARYYGSVDATPLFVVLAGEYLKATGDLDFIRSIWEHILFAIHWIEKYGDADGDGFVEYACRSKRGLVVQGWKDSDNSVFHRDGSNAEAPIALCEVQGYVYHARLNAALIAKKMGEETLSEKLEIEAELLKVKFNDAFWIEELGTYALALDGKKNPCKVKTSNVGHCLYSGIVEESKVESVIQNLMNPQSFCGWGIRTVSEAETRYNPMSYHNGSVWPHDTSLIAMGFARYGHKERSCQLLSAMFDVSREVDLNRLPELFCGFEKRTAQGPTLYPLSCAPQAWAAGTVFMMLQACLGLKIDAEQKQILFESPRLPPSLKSLRLIGLRVGSFGSADLEVIRHSNDIAIHILRRTGDITIVTLK